MEEIRIRGNILERDIHAQLAGYANLHSKGIAADNYIEQGVGGTHFVINWLEACMLEMGQLTSIVRYCYQSRNRLRIEGNEAQIRRAVASLEHELGQQRSAGIASDIVKELFPNDSGVLALPEEPDPRN